MDPDAGIVRSTVILLLFPAILSAAELQTEHLYRLADGEQHPEATLDDALHFGIISFYRRSDACVLFRKGDEVFEQPLVYERTRSP